MCCLCVGPPLTPSLSLGRNDSVEKERSPSPLPSPQGLSLPTFHCAWFIGFLFTTD